MAVESGPLTGATPPVKTAEAPVCSNEPFTARVLVACAWPAQSVNAAISKPWVANFMLNPSYGPITETKSQNGRNENFSIKNES
jgi:hypothetical protein